VSFNPGLQGRRFDVPELRLDSSYLKIYIFSSYELKKIYL